MDTKEIEKSIEGKMTKEEKAGKFYRMYEEARNFDTSRFDDYEENLAYYEMKQNELPANQTNKPWVLNIDTPYAADAINTRAASLMANDYAGELQPLSPDDVEHIKNLNNIYQMFWKQMQMDDLVNQAILYAEVLRETYIHVIFDDKKSGGTNRKNNGKLKGYFLDPASILIDPNSLSFADADYICITERITKDQYKRQYGEVWEEGKGSSFTPDERGESYAGNDYNTNQENVLTKLTFYVKDEEDEDKINKTIMVEHEIIEESEIPISRFPIEQLRWEKRIKSPYGKSLMDRLLPLQKSINAVESATTTAALAFASPSFAVRVGSGVNPAKVAALAGAPGAVFEVNGDPKSAIVPISNGSIDGKLLDIRESNQTEIYRLAGISEQFLGSFGSAGNTKGGSKESSNRAKIVEKLFLTNLEEFIQGLTQIVVEFATKAFEGETLYSPGQKKSDNTYDFQEMNVTKELKDIEYNFYIDMDVRSPYTKERHKELLQELFQIERQYDAPIKTINILDILETYNMPNKQELVERYKELSQRDDAAKSQIIVQFVVVCEQVGVEADMIAQGISEVIAGKGTPTVDKILQQIQQQQKADEQQEVAGQKQVAAKQTQLTEQQMQQRAAKQQAQAQEMQKQKEVTGDEKVTPSSGKPKLTGDETVK
jgi:hypothetical protein